MTEVKKISFSEAERCKIFPLDDLDNRYYYYLKK
jgi:hypothetical protein